MTTRKIGSVPLRGTARFLFVIAGLLLFGGVIAAMAISTHSSAVALPVLLFVGCFTASTILFGLGRLVEAVGELRLEVIGD